MVLFNYSTKEITAKIVYYGPGLCGKTTNLQFVHSKMDSRSRGKLLSLATETDRTLFFDFLPVDLGKMGGFHVRFQLYTVPGQVHYNATRRMVLKGVDAVVFVADSQLAMLEHNRESWDNLAENLVENGYGIENVPVVVQLNKRDLPKVASPGKILEALGVKNVQHFEAVATTGEGVFETLRAIVKLSVAKLRAEFKEEGSFKEPELASMAAPPPPRTPPPQPLYSPDIPAMEMPSPAGRAQEAVGSGSGPEPGQPLAREPLETDSDVSDEISAGPKLAVEEEVDMPGGELEEEPVPEGEIDLEARGGFEEEAHGGEELLDRVGTLAREVEQLREENRQIRHTMARLLQGIGRQIEVLGEMLPGEGGKGTEESD